MSDADEGTVTLRERALAKIKATILAAAPGDFVSEMALARTLNISRTPIREALHQLASQGLVNRVPHVGSFVARLTPRIAREIMEVREALEGRAAGLAAGRMEPEEYDELAQALRASLDIGDERLRFDAMEEAGHAVHVAILRLAENRRITSTLVDLRDQIHRVQAYAISLPGRMEKSHREHGAILDGVFAGDPRQAEWAMREHLEGTKQTLLERLQNEGSVGDDSGSTADSELASVHMKT